MQKKIILFFVLLCLCGSVFSQNNRYSVYNFSPRNYGKNTDAQNWAVLQDHSGLLYFGNANGLIEFDGHRWEFIPCVRGVFTTALAADKEGIVYVGTQFGFGYLIPDLNGKLQYYSLSDSLLDHFFNTIVWKIHTIGNHVYFQTEDAIFDYYDGKIEVILPQNSFHLSFIVNNQLYVRERNNGLMKLSGKKLIKVESGEIFANLGIFGMIELNEKECLVITQEQGIWTYNNNKFAKIDNQDQKTLIQAGIYGAIKLYDGLIALNTVANGIIIINRNGEIVQQINSLNSALHVNDIKQICNDRQGNIWCATNNGISVVYYSSALSVYAKESGVLNNVYSIASFKNKIYAGTSAGLLTMDNSGVFTNLNLTNNSVWALLPSDNELLIGENNSLISYDGKQLKTIDQINVRCFCVVDKPGLLFAGGKKGLMVYQKINGKWTRKAQIAEVTTELISLACSETENGSFTLWAGTALDGVYAISFNSDLAFNCKLYPVNELKTEGYVMPFNIGNNIVLGTNSGLFSINKKNDKYLFDNQPLFGYEIFKPVNFVLRHNHHLFVSLTDLVLHFVNDHFIDKPLAGIDVGKVRSIYAWNDSYCWFGCDDALISYNFIKQKPAKSSFNAVVRQVICNTDSVIFYGKTFKGQDKVVLNYAGNDLTFVFAADFYTYPEQMLFSFMLEGNDNNWSEWNIENKAVYTNLHEGNYIFKVKAKNVFGEESLLGEYHFEIKAPWYRTWKAYIAYCLALILMVLAAIRISSYRLRQKNIRLEKIVKERTAEIAQKNVVLQEQKDVIEKEKAKSEELLLNTLPVKVVEELKEKGYTEPESFENVTVYFSDIKGFTDLSGSLDPKYLISKLNEMFTAFDDIMSKYGCERIKTIGDAYMAVCGLPQSNDNHAELMALASIEILSYLTERNKTDDLPITIRIGLNSGKVTGGIVGVRKYIYDVFGDTVNTASRMESNGEAMKINVSETTYLMLKHKFSFTERPLLEVKGKGVLKMYFLNY